MTSEPKSITQKLLGTIGTYNIKGQIEYRFDPGDAVHKYKVTTCLWLPADGDDLLRLQFINPAILICGEYLDELWGCIDPHSGFRVSEMQFNAYGWASAEAIAKDYLTACVRTVRGVYKRNTEAMDAMPETFEETYTVA